MYRGFAEAQNPAPGAPATYTVAIDVVPPNGGYVARNPDKVFYEAGEPLAMEARTGASGATTRTRCAPYGAKSAAAQTCT
jgi:hypothetical protein